MSDATPPASSQHSDTGLRSRMAPWLSKARLVLLHSFHSLVAPILAALISAWVVRVHSPALWGAFVDVLLVVQLGAHVLAFGNKELLLRSFATGATKERPDAAVAPVFQGALATRAVLLLGPVAALVVAWGLYRGWPLSWLLLAVAWLPAQLLAQSHDVIILYSRRFAAGVTVEATATLCTLGGVVVMGADLTIVQLLAAFVFAGWGKALLLSVGMARQTGLRRWVGQIRPSWLLLALPFFAMGLTGMLQSRVDLYVITALRPPSDTGRYQVLIGLLVYLQAIANFVVLPFVQELYRMPTTEVRRVARWLGLGGLVFSLPATGLLWLALRWIWRIELDGPLLALSASYVWVVWLWLPDVYTLFKLGRERAVLLMNGGGAVLNLALNLWLVPRYGLVGALGASAAVQWLSVGIYRWLVHVAMTEAQNEVQSEVPDVSRKP
ncbi:MAG: polysaccharide biosynthesis C-terminal domain-containing protein [Myxococcales bacterium]|nr:polysaccharide biosynthesis C-terminal domain-containing protein [Myxococcales bacterium]